MENIIRRGGPQNVYKVGQVNWAWQGKGNFLLRNNLVEWPDQRPFPVMFVFVDFLWTLLL